MPLDDSAADPETTAAGQAEESIERRRVSLISDVSSSTLTTMERRVAWILNYYPDARDSDVTLQLRYWETFNSTGRDQPIHPRDLYRLPRLTSLARCRATIQNRLRLFQASPAVRVRRGVLSEEERERGARPNDLPVFAVYADESGKTQDHLVIGSLWLLHGPESLRLTRELLEWKHGSGFAGELHFGDLNFGNLRTYQDATAVVLRNASALSFKAAYIGRRGAGAIQGAIGRLFYYLLAGGIDHEHSSGRGQLPRALQVWKDEEEEGYDRLLLADIADRLVARFGDQLTVDLMEAVPSQGNMLIQIADLFTGSVNRVVNTPARGTATTSAKDQFARYMLGAVGWNPQRVEGVDIAVTVSI